MKKRRMTQWNSTYYRRIAFNSETKGAVESITGDISFMPIEPPGWTALQ
jgi:hypothetical protein